METPYAEIATPLAFSVTAVVSSVTAGKTAGSTLLMRLRPTQPIRAEFTALNDNLPVIQQAFAVN
jgi:hypothetical protein